MNVRPLSKEELSVQLGFSLDRPYGVVTFHPVTLENDRIAFKKNKSSAGRKNGKNTDVTDGDASVAGGRGRQRKRKGAEQQTGGING